jgi:hypothetical protein
MPNDTVVPRPPAAPEVNMQRRWSRIAAFQSATSPEIDALTTKEAKAYVEQRRAFEHEIASEVPSLSCR